MSDASSKKTLVWSLVVVLGILHYDFWFWTDRTLVFGFLPIGMLYQALISVAAGITWWLIVKHAWPSWIEEWADASDDEGQDAA